MASKNQNEFCAILDFGSQYSQLIARRVREANVYSEIISPRSTAAEIAAKAPAGIIFSGGPDSVHADGAIAIDPAVYDLDIPILGICYGAQLIAQQNGGTVGRTDRGEYGRTALTVEGDGGTLLSGTPTQQNVWMSHFDAITVPMFMCLGEFSIASTFTLLSSTGSNFNSGRFSSCSGSKLRLPFFLSCWSTQTELTFVRPMTRFVGSALWM